MCAAEVEGKMPDSQTLLLAFLIFLARILDVSIGTMRTIAVIHGRRPLAWVLGFFEVIVWVSAAARVIQQLDQPILMVAYALGFATGNYVGMTIESWVGFGDQVVRIFTRIGEPVAESLRQAGFGATEFDGMGRDGPISLVFVQVPRRRAPHVAELARCADPECYYTIEDIRHANTSVGRTTPLGGAQATGARK
jgi:uncharacterized protein YebE (UPF0316 family)